MFVHTYSNSRGRAPSDDMFVEEVLLLDIPPDSSLLAKQLQESPHLIRARKEACANDPKLVGAGILEGFKDSQLHALPPRSDGEDAFEMGHFLGLASIKGTSSINAHRSRVFGATP
eukprot:Skav226755  [mRNA]  locus=scaffold3942:174402:176864:+ [translate_table: standard]